MIFDESKVIVLEKNDKNLKKKLIIFPWIKE